MTLHSELKALSESADANAQSYAKEMTQGYNPNVLERFKSPSSNYEANPNDVRLTLNIQTSEFTSLCPMTGQPDFATIKIEYTPDEYCVESKSLKLYFLSFRNHRDFHETCVNRICNDLATLLEPYYLKVTGEFTPRGGIPFWPTCEFSK
jgi:7-cyano-7-deazaguanine reductase